MVSTVQDHTYNYSQMSVSTLNSRKITVVLGFGEENVLIQYKY